jgi:UDP-glucose 4-epimerase
MPEANKVLVTGGAGFIGGHLIAELLARGDHVTVIDDLSTGRRDNLGGFPSDRVTFLEGTVRARLVGDVAATPFDEMYHLAAAVGVKLVVESPIQCIETNVHETSVVLHVAAEHGCPVLLASTSEVYGKSDRIPFEEGDDVVYGPTTEPRWSYACSKAIDEHLGLAWHREAGLPVAIARFFNTVGPRQRGRWGMVLPRFVANALSGNPLRVHGDGLQERCFIDVRDVAPLLPVLLGDPRAHGAVINVGHDQPISILDLASRVIDVLGSSSEIEFMDIEDDYGRPIEDLRRRVPKLDRLHAITGRRPSIDLEDTIRATAESINMDHDS